jgi:hypothetical protein
MSRSDIPRPVEKKQRKIFEMKTLKMCFGKDRLKHREPIEPGNIVVVSN